MKTLVGIAAIIDKIEVEADGEEWVVSEVKALRDRRNSLYFIGNGGSTAIASHMAIDWLNRAHVSAFALNDGPALTCLSNDYGYEEVFHRQLLQHLRSGDMLMIISSSGKSPNVLRSLQAANGIASIVTFSGFAPDNPLRKFGGANFYVPSSDYGIVETAHLGILHALLDKVAI